MEDFRLETLDEFRKRTNSFNQTSLPERGMITGSGLSKKVSPTGRLLRYEGSTVVFELPDAVKTELACKCQALFLLCKVSTFLQNMVDRLCHLLDSVNKDPSALVGRILLKRNNTLHGGGSDPAWQL